MSKRRHIEIDHEHEAKLKSFFGRWQGMFEKSIQGGIESHLEMTSLHQARKYAREHGYSIDPDGDITANITAETRSPGGNDPELGPLADYSFVSRRVNLVRKGDPYLYEALEGHFGALGFHWELQAQHETFEAKVENKLVTRYGRLLSLFHMTAAGQRMIEDETSRPAVAPKPEGTGSKLNRTQRRKAARDAQRAADLAAQENGGAPFEDLALEQKLRTLSGRMIVLISTSSGVERVQEGCARCEIESWALLGQAAQAWNAADARIVAEQPIARRA